MNALHPAAPHDLPPFIAGPDGSDTLMAALAVFLVLVVFMVGVLFLRLHTLPERIAHRGRKLQVEIVAILGSEGAHEQPIGHDDHAVDWV